MGEILVLYEGQKQTFLSACSVPDTVLGALHTQSYVCLLITGWVRMTFLDLQAHSESESYVKSVLSLIKVFLVQNSYQGRHVSARVDLLVECPRRAPKSGHALWQCCVHTTYIVQRALSLCLWRRRSPSPHCMALWTFACLGLVRKVSSYKWLLFTL